MSQNVTPHTAPRRDTNRTYVPTPCRRSGRPRTLDRELRRPRSPKSYGLRYVRVSMACAYDCECRRGPLACSMTSWIVVRGVRVKMSLWHVGEEAVFGSQNARTSNGTSPNQMGNPDQEQTEERQRRRAEQIETTPRRNVFHNGSMASRCVADISPQLLSSSYA